MSQTEIPIKTPPAGDLDRPAATRTEPRWWRRPWIIPLALVVAGFLYYQVTPFARAGANESLAPLPPHDGFPAYYPLLWGHIVFGTVSMVTVVLQVWPKLRINRPAVHRWSGRIYVVAALVTGVIGLILVRFATPVGQIGVTAATVLWLACTIAGYVLVRRGKYALHRRFMLYSFALVMNNVWGVVIVNVGLLNGAEILYLIEAARWVGWVGNLMLVQWWLYRTADRPLHLPVRARPARAGR
ncbi:DUF2306 domain-containing protein [Nonomuraea sp. MG754425]|uniref:DUF2306 domain-containing protein n=1 Tax=Nonomuraea sp. MG754425 TaxID=2570319 RepID=UPI0027E14F29|nr:DUF2306 domain-containing protein [Nonomuraea sp. MG754425]